MKVSKKADALSLAILAIDLAQEKFSLENLTMKNPNAQDLENLETFKGLLKRATFDLQKGKLSKMFNAYMQHESSENSKKWVFDFGFGFSLTALKHQYRSYRNYDKLIYAIENLDYMKSLKR